MTLGIDTTAEYIFFWPSFISAVLVLILSPPLKIVLTFFEILDKKENGVLLWGGGSWWGTDIRKLEHSSRVQGWRERGQTGHHPSNFQSPLSFCMEIFSTSVLCSAVLLTAFFVG